MSATALINLLSYLPTTVAVPLVVVLVVYRSQQAVATLVALFSNDQQRADRALRVLRVLRGLPDLEPDKQTSAIDKRCGRNPD